MASELELAVTKLGITLSANHLHLVIPPKTNVDNWVHDLWDITLFYQGRDMLTTYMTGIGHRTKAYGVKETFQGLKLVYTKVDNGNYYSVLDAARLGLLVVKKPSVADVIYSLMTDSLCSENTFDEWCEDFGYDTDSRKALDTYLKCQETYIKVRRLLGSSTFSDIVRLEH